MNIDKHTKLALATQCKRYDAFKSSEVINILGALIQDAKEKELAKKAGEMYAFDLLGNAVGKDWAADFVRDAVKEELVNCDVDITSGAAVECLTADTAVPYAQHINPKAGSVALCYAQAVALRVILNHDYESLMFGAVDGGHFARVMRRDTFDMIGELCLKGEL